MTALEVLKGRLATANRLSTRPTKWATVDCKEVKAEHFAECLRQAIKAVEREAEKATPPKASKGMK